MLKMVDTIQMGFAPSGTLQFPRSSQLLLYGPPGVVKANLAIRYLCDRLEQGESCIYTTTVWSPQQIRKTATTYIGKNLVAKLRIIDGVSCIAGKTSQEPYAFPSLYNLNTINLILLQALADVEQGHLCIDSLTTLMTYSTPISVIKFLQVLCAKVKDRGVTAIYLLEKGVQDREVIATLRYSVDGVIETRDKEAKGSLQHQIRLTHVRGAKNDSSWLQFSETEPLQKIS
jgi:KaiC/GvpD/RAD55 family RecA-like ATPase